MNETFTPVSIPFWYTVRESILFEVSVSGQARMENGNLVLEYRLQTDNLNKMLVYFRRKLKGSFTPEALETGSILQISISPSDIAKVELSSSWFKPVALLYIACRSLKTLENMPGEKAGTLELQIRKQDVSDARKMIRQLMGN